MNVVGTLSSNSSSEDDDESNNNLSVHRQMTTTRVAAASASPSYPVTIWAAGSSIAPGLVDTVSSNIKIMLNALGVPVIAILYYRTRSTAIPGEASHLFVAVDERQRVVRVSSARLALITSTIDPGKLKEYTASMTFDPLGALLLRVGGGTGERVGRFPPIFGFRAPRGEKQIYDRTPELQAMRRDGYFSLTFLPVPGVDHRLQIATEIASLWGYSVVARDKRWPDLLILRNDNPERDDLGGVPDETWLYHALSRVLEDHLPVVELDGLWMGSLPRSSQHHLGESRSRVFYAILDWVRVRRLPYMTARTFHCYVRRDLSAVMTLGSLRDRMELISWLEMYPFDKLQVVRVKGEVEAAELVFGSRSLRAAERNSIAIRDFNSAEGWIVIGLAGSGGATTSSSLEKVLREYYGSKGACDAPGSPVTASQVATLPLRDLIKIVRIAECEAASSGVCLLPSSSTTNRENNSYLPPSWTTSHRAYRAAVRSQVLRSHDTIGVYRLGPYKSPFFAFDVHQYIAMPAASRYQAVVSQVSLAPEIGEGEDKLLKVLVGTVWLLTIQEAATQTTAASEIEVMQVASDRDGEDIRRILFKAWKTGHLIGTWCRVMLSQRETLSVLVAGGTVDPLVAHAGDSIVDGNRWLDITSKTIQECG